MIVARGAESVNIMMACTSRAMVVILVACSLLAGCGVTDDRLSRARDLVEVGDLQTADKLLLELISEKPKTTDAHLARAAIALMEDDYERLIELLQYSINAGAKPDRITASLFELRDTGKTTLGTIKVEVELDEWSWQSYSSIALELDSSLVHDADFAYDYYVEYGYEPEVFLEEFPTDERVPDALLRLASDDNRADSYVRLQACNRLIEEYPETDWSERAKQIKENEIWFEKTFNLPVRRYHTIEIAGISIGDELNIRIIPPHELRSTLWGSSYLIDERSLLLEIPNIEQIRAESRLHTGGYASHEEFQKDRVLRDSIQRVGPGRYIDIVSKGQIIRAKFDADVTVDGENYTIIVSKKEPW